MRTIFAISITVVMAWTQLALSDTSCPPVSETSYKGQWSVQNSDWDVWHLTGKPGDKPFLGTVVWQPKSVLRNFLTCWYLSQDTRSLLGIFKNATYPDSNQYVDLDDQTIFCGDTAETAPIWSQLKDEANNNTFDIYACSENPSSEKQGKCGWKPVPSGKNITLPGCACPIHPQPYDWRQSAFVSVIAHLIRLPALAKAKQGCRRSPWCGPEDSRD